MDSTKKASLSDEEEDLEALRLAALQTLKKPSNPNEGSNNDLKNDVRPKRSYRAGMRGQGNYGVKRGRYFGHRGSKNGQFHNRAISSNLISLTPTLPSEPKATKEASNDSKLTLTQDRFNNKADSESGKTDEKCSKFDRYKDSDESEDEDTEDELLRSDSDDDSPLKLTRSDSLEALMQELDDEIQGKTKINSEEKSKGKIKSKRKRVETEQESEKPAPTVESSPKEIEKTLEEPKEVIKSEELATHAEPPKPTSLPKSPELQQPPKKCRRSPPFKREFRDGPRGNPRKFQRVTPPQNNPLPPFMPVPPVYSLPAFAPGVIMNPAPFLDARPISPLHINAETLQNQTLAPLSPRSAAFVLQNRAIIEKRKRSPRRSYSRSPSPRSPRRSVSPRRRSLSPRDPIRKRSLTPIRKRLPSPFRKRSLSPLRKRSPRRRSISPKRRPFSPKQRPISPKAKQNSPKRRSLSPLRRRDRDRKVTAEPTEGASKPKQSIRERLGMKSSKPEEKESTKDKPVEDQSLPEEDKPLDPVLEARKKKFESKEIKIREGVIRLKPKVEDSNIKKQEEKLEETSAPAVKSEDDDVVNEDLLLEDDELELDADHADLFSDEDSATDNEGRFKAKEVSEEKPTAISFNKLTNGAKPELRPERPIESRPRRSRARSRSPRLRTGRKLTEVKSAITQASRSTKSENVHQTSRKKFGVKSERHPKKFERKIEIKIKNPSKYTDREEKEAARAIETGVEVGVGSEHVVDKVEIEDDDDETEIVIENYEGEIENVCSSEGDLRAQLSKKRAEKLQSRTTVSREGVSSRLLQTALKHALPVKKPKKSKKKDLSSGELETIKSLFTADFIASRLQLTVRSKRQVTIYKRKKFPFGFRRSHCRPEGKVPIHLRLGLSYESDLFDTSVPKLKKKSKKRKRIEAEEQHPG
ncbi:serine/arginine repetitive matrix protein 1-like isoform X2 [Anthonomus grandis grandis]|uniref:serine/arginine repetitive matrix protein 1-like isoform X2 n=1 Tax=Anthonomus grandis grandis TaxID=2921223 RepID=UPI0021662296|nr:serine/arginine repetitive matrix protein 1-like isoform X2 [Anthonomus grandis grandis]